MMGPLHRLAERVVATGLQPANGAPNALVALTLPLGAGVYIVDRLNVWNTTDGSGATTYAPTLYEQNGVNPRDRILGSASVAHATPIYLQGGTWAQCQSFDGALYLSLHLDASDGSDIYSAALTVHKVG